MYDNRLLIGQSNIQKQMIHAVLEAIKEDRPYTELYWYMPAYEKWEHELSFDIPEV